MTLLVALLMVAFLCAAAFSVGRAVEAEQPCPHERHDRYCRCALCAEVAADFADVADTPDPYDWRCDPGALGADVVPLRRGERR